MSEAAIRLSSQSKTVNLASVPEGDEFKFVFPNGELIERRRLSFKGDVAASAHALPGSG